MELTEALGLRRGDFVTHRATMIPDQPVKVADVWINRTNTIVRIRLPAIDPHQWLDAMGYSLPPKGKRWCRQCKGGTWHTTKEWKELHPSLSGALLERRERHTPELPSD